MTIYSNVPCFIHSITTQSFAAPQAAKIPCTTGLRILAPSLLAHGSNARIRVRFTTTIEFCSTRSPLVPFVSAGVHRGDEQRPTPPYPQIRRRLRRAGPHVQLPAFCHHQGTGCERRFQHHLKSQLVASSTRMITRDELSCTQAYKELARACNKK